MQKAKITEPCGTPTLPGTKPDDTLYVYMHWVRSIKKLLISLGADDVKLKFVINCYQLLVYEKCNRKILKNLTVTVNCCCSKPLRMTYVIFSKAVIAL